LNSLPSGARILVTRPQHQAEPLCRLIQERGGIAVRFPALEIRPMPQQLAQQETLVNLDRFDWVIFSSANAVHFALMANDGKIAKPAGVRFAAIGKATAKALHKAGLDVDLLPGNNFTSEALLETAPLQNLHGASCLIVRGQGGRELLAATLRVRGASVACLEVYRRQKPAADPGPVIQLLAEGQLQASIVTSGEALQNLLEMLGNKASMQLLRMPLVVISDRLERLAAARGFKVIAVSEPADAAIVETVTVLINGEQRGRRIE